MFVQVAENHLCRLLEMDRGGGAWNRIPHQNVNVNILRKVFEVECESEGNVVDQELKYHSLFILCLK